ncbi:hypothetical protein, partial [Lactobacillus crispatus]|uniref:hypothetical protein n=1 Tax=Lactobacillus crispatus TaxID=47770 RepID=UPI00197CB22D
EQSKGRKFDETELCWARTCRNLSCEPNAVGTKWFSRFGEMFCAVAALNRGSFRFDRLQNENGESGADAHVRAGGCHTNVKHSITGAPTMPLWRHSVPGG